jgi:hypothetical protein
MGRPGPAVIAGLCGTILALELPWMHMGHRLTNIYTRTGDTGPKDRATCFAPSVALIAAT